MSKVTSKDIHSVYPLLAGWHSSILSNMSWWCLSKLLPLITTATLPTWAAMVSIAGAAVATEVESAVAPRVLPLLSDDELRIDSNAVSASGLSAGADFVVQLQVAYSSLFAGIGVFAGQSYHCAVHRFPNDAIVPANSTK